ncbi:uncharacterized protein AB675_302 [Cyphellophora attinorum]|uniref:Uncharacterized protein n=1 Tax=Cyphellophora attinorum TaxID=1664694 RepID=A0A0N1HBI8_9EURO|nr:uncharacterized protein AB675_302 [Phialophora attinorum]KPI46026.1 hypothetical protein AB675_302 [Phialophora attinorum]
MPVANLHLLHISPALPLKSALQVLSKTSPAPLTLSVPVRWMITPNALSNAAPSPLLKVPWSILLITLSSDLPSAITSNLIDHYHLRVGVPSRLIDNFKSKNETLLHPEPSDVPSLTGSLDSPRFGKTSQTIELTPDVLQWIQSMQSRSDSWRTGAISMLNLLAFKEGLEFKESYLKYGKAFGEDIGKKRGGTAKLVGNVIQPTASKGKGTSPDVKQQAKEWSGVARIGDSPNKGTSPGVKQEAKEWSGIARIGDDAGSSSNDNTQDRKWDEFALAHYPSLKHFADMVGSEDYQAVNLKNRVPALADTCILFTSELLAQEILAADDGTGKAKL